MKQGLCDKIVTREERKSEGYLYTYELTVREGERTADWRLPLYSVKIKMTDNEGKSSQREARDLFTCPKRAREFFDKLVRNLATPIDLGYVVEDEVRS